MTYYVYEGHTIKNDIFFNRGTTYVYDGHSTNKDFLFTKEGHIYTKVIQ